MKFHTLQGEPFKISAHLLHNMMASATRQQGKEPTELTAFALYHWPVLPATEYYYSRVTTGCNMDGEEQAGDIVFLLPGERTIEQMDEDILDVLERRQPLSETTFGFCAQVHSCSCRYNGSIGIGCPYLVPDPAKRGVVIKWRDAYAEQAGNLEKAGATEDALQARMRVQGLDDLIRTMDLMQQAIAEWLIADKKGL